MAAWRSLQRGRLSRADEASASREVTDRGLSKSRIHASTPGVPNAYASTGDEVGHSTDNLISQNDLAWSCFLEMSRDRIDRAVEEQRGYINSSSKTVRTEGLTQRDLPAHDREAAVSVVVGDKERRASLRLMPCFRDGNHGKMHNQSTTAEAMTNRSLVTQHGVL